MQVSKEKCILGRKYGPPSHIRPKLYNSMLELLEVQSNKRLYSEYAKDITNYQGLLESSSSLNVPMIDLQPEVQWFMRPFLLDFLIELHSSFRLQPQTLFLCLNIVDRYCSKRIVFKRHYQLVGCTALWIAGKYEDKKSRVPTIKELSMMCRNAYDEDMFVQMEMHILSTLEWSLGHPNLEDCLQLAISCSKIPSDTTPFKYNAFLKSSSMLSAVTAVGRFLCELSLYNREFLSVPTSVVSVTAHLISCSMLQIPNAAVFILQMTKQMDSQNSSLDMIDEDSENRIPDVEGPFLSCFDRTTLNTIRKLTIFYILQLTKVTEVLTKKYEELGVIQVVDNFNKRYSEIIKVVHQNKETFEESPLDAYGNGNFVHITDVILQLPLTPAYHTHDETTAPLTPPSASSQFSVFSSNSVNAYGTPLKSYKLNTGGDMSETSPPEEFINNDWSSPIPSKMHM